MRLRVIHVIGALAILLGVVGLGAAVDTGVPAGVVGIVAPAPVEAACTIAIGYPQWHINGYHGEESASGCPSLTIQTCLQNTAGTVYGCVTYSGSGASVFVWSATASSRYGCTQRTWAWNSYFNQTWVSSYRAVC